MDGTAIWRAAIANGIPAALGCDSRWVIYEILIWNLPEKKISTSDLRRLTNLSETTIKKSRDQLVDLGLVRYDGSPGGSEKGTYEILSLTPELLNNLQRKTGRRMEPSQARPPTQPKNSAAGSTPSEARRSSKSMPHGNGPSKGVKPAPRSAPPRKSAPPVLPVPPVLVKPPGSTEGEEFDPLATDFGEDPPRPTPPPEIAALPPVSMAPEEDEDDDLTEEQQHFLAEMGGDDIGEVVEEEEFDDAE